MIQMALFTEATSRSRDDAIFNVASRLGMPYRSIQPARDLLRPRFLAIQGDAVALVNLRGQVLFDGPPDNAFAIRWLEIMLPDNAVVYAVSPSPALNKLRAWGCDIDPEYDDIGWRVAEYRATDGLQSYPQWRSIEAVVRHMTPSTKWKPSSALDAAHRVRDIALTIAKGR